MKNIKEVVHKVIYILDKKQFRRLVLLLVLLVLETIFELIGVISIYPFINILMDRSIIKNNFLLHKMYDMLGCSDDTSFLCILAVLIIIIYIVKNIFNAFSNYVRYGFVYSSKREIGVRLMKGYLEEPYIFFTKHNSSELMNAIFNDVSQFFDLILYFLFIFSDIVLIIVFGIYLIYIDVFLSLACIFTMLTFGFLFLKVNKNRTAMYGKKTQESLKKMTQSLQNGFGGIKEIKILQKEDYFISDYEVNCRNYNRTNQKYQFINSLPHLVLECFCVIVVMVVIIIRMFNDAHIDLFVPSLSVFAVALFRIFPRISRLNSSLNSIVYGKAFLDSVYNYVILINENEKKRENSEKTDLFFKNEIKLQKVSFSYPGSNQEILSNVDITIKKNDIIGIIGPSGAGKSTFIDILLGLLSPDSGTITVDGKNICSNCSTWLNMIGYVPQSIYLSDDSIIQNVAFGIKPCDISIDKVIESLKQAQLYEFIMSLPEGMETKVGERGVRFSGGQRQRIGIARALYRNPEVIFLDEATSALDADTENAFMEDINRLAGKKTIIIVAHRISTLKTCNHIFNIEKGCVEEIDKTILFN